MTHAAPLTPDHWRHPDLGQGRRPFVAEALGTGLLIVAVFGSGVMG
jgi:hypothetical protein